MNKNVMHKLFAAYVNIYVNRKTKFSGIIYTVEEITENLNGNNDVRIYGDPTKLIVTREYLLNNLNNLLEKFMESMKNERKTFTSIYETLKDTLKYSKDNIISNFHIFELSSFYTGSFEKPSFKVYLDKNKVEYIEKNILHKIGSIDYA